MAQFVVFYFLFGLLGIAMALIVFRFAMIGLDFVKNIFTTTKR